MRVSQLSKFSQLDSDINLPNVVSEFRESNCLALLGIVKYHYTYPNLILLSSYKYFNVCEPGLQSRRISLCHMHKEGSPEVQVLEGFKCFLLQL